MYLNGATGASGSAGTLAFSGPSTTQSGSSGSLSQFGGSAAADLLQGAAARMLLTCYCVSSCPLCTIYILVLLRAFNIHKNDVLCVAGMSGCLMGNAFSAMASSFGLGPAAAAAAAAATVPPDTYAPNGASAAAILSPPNVKQ